MSSVTSEGKFSPPARSRIVVFGWAPEATIGAVWTVPSASVTPVTRPPVESIEATSASVWISAPAARALEAIASEIAPMPPITWPQRADVAVELAERVVEKVVGGARGVGAGPDADDPGRGDRALQVVVLEEPVEHVADGHREDADQLLDVALGHARDAAGLLEDSRDVDRRLRAERRGLADHHRAHEVGGHEEQVLELLVAGGVLLGELGDRLAASWRRRRGRRSGRRASSPRRRGRAGRPGSRGALAPGRRRPSAGASRRRRRRARRGRLARPLR